MTATDIDGTQVIAIYFIAVAFGGVAAILFALGVGAAVARVRRAVVRMVSTPLARDH